MTQSLDILKEERSAVRQEAEALWRSLGRNLLTMLAASAVILALALGYADGPRFKKYQSALKEFKSLDDLHKNLRQEGLKDSDVISFNGLEGKELAVLGDLNLKEIINGLKVLSEDWSGVGTEGVTLLQASKEFLHQIERVDRQKAPDAEHLGSRIEGNPVYARLIWEEAILTLDFPEIIDKTLKHILKIQMNLPSISPVNKYTTSDLTMDDLLVEINRDIKTALREITELRIAYQGLELSIPVTGVLYWYPVAWLLFVIMIWDHVLKARKRTGVYQELSLMLRRGSSTPPPIEGSGQEDRYPSVQSSSQVLRLQVNHFILLSLFLVSNVYVVYYLDGAFKNMLPTLIEAASDYGYSLFFYGHRAWRFIVAGVFILLVFILMFMSLGLPRVKLILSFSKRPIRSSSKIHIKNSISPETSKSTGSCVSTAVNENTPAKKSRT